MIITRTPFRITLGGGGTDLPSFYREHGGFVFTMAINKYMYICLNRRSVADRKIVIRYSQVETVDGVDEIKHPLAREALRLHGVRENIELTSIADMPGKSGLGSSGAYLVGLLTAIRAYKRTAASPAQADRRGGVPHRDGCTQGNGGQTGPVHRGAGRVPGAGHRQGGEGRGPPRCRWIL
jgi:D-glycero-alpha-D-manno-heptose-7-phosphate kinase